MRLAEDAYSIGDLGPQRIDAYSTCTKRNVPVKKKKFWLSFLNRQVLLSVQF